VIILLISGKQGAGKSTLARGVTRHFRGKNWGVTEVKFAKPVYELHNACRTVMESYGFEPKEKYGGLLQYLGTDWGRKEFGDNVWVDCLINFIKQERFLGVFEQDLTVVEDCRFKNELFGMKRSFGEQVLSVRLHADRDTRKKRADSWRENEKHPSEVDLDDSENSFDVKVDTASLSEQQVLAFVVKAIETKRRQLGPGDVPIPA